LTKISSKRGAILTHHSWLFRLSLGDYNNRKRVNALIPHIEEEQTPQPDTKTLAFFYSKFFKIRQKNGFLLKTGKKA